MKTNNQITGSNKISRRKFVGIAASGSVAITILPSFTVSGLGHVPPSDKLYIAAIGCGGEGAADIRTFMKTPKKNAVISHLCDVDDRMAAERRREYPKAPFYHDWREMFEKESKNFDAVTVAIPDHNHAIVGLSAMQLNKHLYLQKPLSHDIYEARILTEASIKYKVVTQMGDQGASSEGMRTLREWIEAGVLGDIEKVYCWTDRPVWPQGISWPKNNPRVPKIWCLLTGVAGGSSERARLAIWVVISLAHRSNCSNWDIQPMFPEVPPQYMMEIFQKLNIRKADLYPAQLSLSIN
jgi:hypothetical protein